MNILRSIYAVFLPYCVIRACVILLVTGLSCVALSALYRQIVQRSTQRSHFFSVALFRALYGPLLVFVAIMGVCYALEWLFLNWQLEDRKLFRVLYNLFFVGFFTWFLWRFVSLYSQVFLQHGISKSVIDSTLVYALSRIARIVIITIAALSLFQILGLSITGVLAFGGMGGIIIGFASKDLLANIFGSLLLFLDRPFVIGDHIVLPALEVEGQVQAIGWRVCKVLMPNGYPVYVPNALFSNLLVENRSRRHYRRFACAIRVRYQDFTSLLPLLQEMKSLLKEHPAIDKTREITVNLSELAPSSLNISIEAYTDMTNNADFLALQQALYMVLLDCIRRHGVPWAVPSSTIFIDTEQSTCSAPP